ncbi:MAG: alpha/beta hydrolase fold domain-containing protein [Pseudomonadota bacterium]
MSTMVRPAHWRDRMINFGARNLVRPSLALPVPWSVHRAGFAMGGVMRPRAPGVTTQEVEIAGRPALIHRTENPKRRLLWMHGGGFTVGSPWTHAGLCSHLALEADAAIICPSYRRAPEHPFPAAFDDALAALKEAEGIETALGPLALGGDSAGGCLILSAMAQRLREGARYATLLLSSPAGFIDGTRPIPPEARDLLFPISILRRIARDYAGNADPRDPRLSPIFERFEHAPPTLIHCVTEELLAEDSEKLEARMREDGVDVHLEKFSGAPHAFHFMAGASPRANAALRRLVAFWTER